MKVAQGCSVELSHEGYDFLTAIFEKYDQDGDKALSPQELVNLFGTSPVMPWGPEVYNTAPTNEKGWISLHGYLSLWTLATLLDTRQTMEYLAYLGYTYYTGEESQVGAFQVTRFVAFGYCIFLILSNVLIIVETKCWIWPRSKRRVTSTDAT